MQLSAVNINTANLSAKNITFYYDHNKKLIKNLNLNIKQGEIIGIMGPSGCGKTTFAKILAGYYKPIEGIVLLDGNPLPIKGYNPVQLIFQHPEKAINPRWQMKKTLQEAGMLNSELMVKFGISESWLNRWPNELSSGELQRFCIIRALNDKTRFLIADEITTMLDAITQAQIWHNLIELIEKRNLGACIISHDLELLKRLCTKIINFQEINSQA